MKWAGTQSYRYLFNMIDEIADIKNPKKHEKRKATADEISSFIK